MKPSLEEVIEFVCEFSGDHKSVITEHTRLDADLGITGDDGVELLEDAEKKFGVSFVTEERSFQETFGLGENEYLFNSDGLDLLGIGGLGDWEIGELVEEGAAFSGEGFECGGVVAGFWGW